MKLSKVLGGVGALTTNLYLASATLAQFNAGDWVPDDGQGPTDLPSLVQTVLTWLLGFAIVIAVVIIIVAGYMYITAAGDEAKIKKATTTLTWAIVGLIVAFLALLLVRFVMSTFLGREGAV